MTDEYVITTRSEGLLGYIGRWGAALITDEELLEALAAHDAEVRASVQGAAKLPGNSAVVPEEPSGVDMIDALIDRYMSGEANRFNLSMQTITWLRAQPEYQARYAAENREEQER